MSEETIKSSLLRKKLETLKEDAGRVFSVKPDGSDPGKVIFKSLGEIFEREKDWVSHNEGRSKCFAWSESLGGRDDPSLGLGGGILERESLRATLDFLSAVVGEESNSENIQGEEESLGRFLYWGVQDMISEVDKLETTGMNIMSDLRSRLAKWQHYSANKS